MGPLVARTQCVPENCLDSLPPYGGICNRTVMDGRSGETYLDFASFHITSVCLDAGLLDSAYSGIGAKMLKMHSFVFSGLPAGMTGSTSQSEYSAPANGCGSISGIPAQAGVFEVRMQFQVNIRTWPLSSVCSGFFSLDLNNRPLGGSFILRVVPDAGFSGPDSVCCFGDPPVTLVPLAYPGGTFSGPGVSGNLFDPSLAGSGTHVIRYEVTVAEGSAIAPATGSSALSVTVRDRTTCFPDADNDGYGDPANPLPCCACPAGYVANADDCADDKPGVHPGASDIPGNAIDEDCSGSDSTVTTTRKIGETPFSLFPNPAHDFIILEGNGIPMDATVRICSSQGQILIRQPVRAGGEVLDVRGLSPGIYFLVLTDRRHTHVVKFSRE